MVDFITPKDFYRFLTPADLYGRVRVRTGTGVEDLDQSVVSQIYDNYMGPAVSGVDMYLNLSQLGPETGKGILFNTSFQDYDSPSPLYLDSAYYTYKDPASGGLIEIGNLYEALTGKSVPTLPHTINLLRTPQINPSKKKVFETEFFLNNIPTLFSSQMVPYFDMELQLPTIPASSDNGLSYLNRPSLLRFLLGSTINFALTEADKSLIAAYSTPKRDNENATSSFLGMEFFTTPQTLTNMSQIYAKEGVRLSDVKPFMPPASLLNASIKILNAGAGVFQHKTADVELKVHDKSRLSEFSEFLRGPPGYSDITVWLTYGWLAPRGRGEEDAYAKFINENMLVREAFGLKNASYSFDTAGQVQLKLELVTKGITAFDNSKLDTAAEGTKDVLDKLRKAAEDVAKNKAAFGNPPEGVNKEMRIFQLLDAAAAGDTEIDIPEDKIEPTINEAIESVKKSQYIKDKPAAIKALQATMFLFKYGNKKVLQLESFNYSKKIFENLTSLNNPDPFLPEEEKVLQLPDGTTQKFYSDDLIAATKEKPAPPAAQGPGGGAAKDGADKAPKFDFPIPAENARSMASFGKVFTSFCLPSILDSAKKEGIDEVQVNFYQLNESCGPLSLHNIAEFPIDIRMLVGQFGDYCARRGGETMTVSEFVRLIVDNVVSDNRSPGYGMVSFYEPYDINNTEEKQMKDEKEFDRKLTDWSQKYPGFKKPLISLHMETRSIGESSFSSVDLLTKLQSTVGAGAVSTGPLEEGQKSGKIKIIHIYDKQLNPYAKVATDLARASDGSFLVYEKAKLAQQEILDTGALATENAAAGQALQKWEKGESSVNVNGQIVKIKGQAQLKEFLASGLPTLTIGHEGSMITQATLASKADGLLGTINLLGSSFKAKATVAPNGLSMSETELPLRVMPAQLTMSSMGCPIADLYQTYFIDFGTGTTIDNLYSVTQLAHSFSPGKFETSWTFAYVDGYGRFAGAAKLGDVIKDLTKPPVDEAPPDAPPPEGQPSPSNNTTQGSTAPTTPSSGGTSNNTTT